jgi:hypothetical protein
MNAEIVTEPTMEALAGWWQYFGDHYNALLQIHANEWVAIGDEGLVATGRDLQGLIDAVEAAGLSTRRDVLVRFVAPGMDRLIL